MKLYLNKSLLRPFFIISLIYSIQFIFWLLFFPEKNTVETGEPKEKNLIAIISYVIAFAATLIGCYFGEASSKASRKKHIISSSVAYKIAVFFLFFAVSATILKLGPLIRNPALIIKILEPAGINLVNIELRDSYFGVSTLQSLWVIPAILFAFLRFGGDISGHRFFKFFEILTFLNVLAFSAINAARTELINYLLIYFSVYTYQRNPKISMIKLMLIFSIIPFIYWLQSLYRDGLVFANESGAPILSAETMNYIFSVFIEKYVSGEFNNALIIMGYDHDWHNWAYASMFNIFFPSEQPSRHLNTMHIYGYWYWQFGFFGMTIVSLLFGIILGVFYKKSFHPMSARVLTWQKIVYVMLYLSIFNSTRLNFIFSVAFIVPLLLFFVALNLINLLPKSRRN